MMDRELLVLSTVHLSDATCLHLARTDCMEWPVVGGPFRDLGFLCHADETLAYGECDEPDPFQDLAAVFRYACDRGYYRVLFYDLGDVVEGLPIYRDPEEEPNSPLLYQGRLEPAPQPLSNPSTLDA